MRAYFDRGLALLLGASAIAGCDRAGAVDVVEPPRRTARLDLRIGSVDDSATMLTDFRELLVGPDGHIYSLHWRDSNIRVHAPEERLVRTMGQPGEGPGEFRTPWNMGLHGDTLWVFDSDTYRFTWFDAAGELIESRAFPVDFGDRDHSPPRPSGLLRDRTVWGTSTSMSIGVAEGRITHQVDVLFDTTGAITDTLVERSITNSVWLLRDPDRADGLAKIGPQPFSAVEIAIVAEDRPELVVVERPIAADARRGEFRVTKLALDGDTLFSSSFAYVPRTIPPALSDSLVREFAAPPPRPPPSGVGVWPASARALELARASMLLPAFFPPVSAVVLGHDGTIWLGRESGGGAMREWWIIDEQGQPIGAVSLPQAFRVMAAERDRVWGMEKDELDVPYIVRYVIESNS